MQTEGCLQSEHDGFQEDGDIYNSIENGRFRIFQILCSIPVFPSNVKTYHDNLLGRIANFWLLSFSLQSILQCINSYMKRGKCRKKDYQREQSSILHNHEYPHVRYVIW